MDLFTSAGKGEIGPGGVKCPCCNRYHTFGNHARKLRGLSKLKRSRLKNNLRKELEDVTQIQSI